MKLIMILLLAVTVHANSLTIQDVPKTVTLSDGRIVPGPSGVICEQGCERYSSTVETHKKKKVAIVLAIVAAGVIAWAICRAPERWPGMPMMTPTPGATIPPPVNVPELPALALVASGLLCAAIRARGESEGAK